MVVDHRLFALGETEFSQAVSELRVADDATTAGVTSSPSLGGSQTTGLVLLPSMGNHCVELGVG
jgi:hypothetical protein